MLSMACLAAGMPLLAAQGEAASAALPEPLTLTEALSYADRAHPTLDLARSELELARAELRATRAATRVGSYLELVPQIVKVSSDPFSELTADSRARVVVSKPLYDFGRSRQLHNAAELNVGAREHGFHDTRQQRRIDIMAAFFEVLLADLRFAVDNEAMALAYIRYDVSREEQSLGVISDIDVLEREHRYRQVLVRRTDAEKRQAAARASLARALGRPDDVPRELERPQLKGNDREAPEFAATLARVLQINPALKALNRELAASEAQLAAQHASRWPTLNAEFEAAAFERSISSRNDLRAMLSLRVPLYQGGALAADIDRAAAAVHEARARLGRVEDEVRGRVLDLVQRLESLKIAREAARQHVEFRDRYLDRARAAYELEVKTDFGDALVRMTEAQWAAEAVEFELALAWARLEAMRGELVAAHTNNRVAH